MLTKAKVRQWGSSLGIVISKDVVLKERLREGDEILIEIRKIARSKDAFGMLRDWSIDNTQIKKSIEVSQ